MAEVKVICEKGVYKISISLQVKKNEALQDVCPSLNNEVLLALANYENKNSSNNETNEEN